MSKKSNKRTVKRSLLFIKKLAPEDWRGILALIVTIGGLVLIGVAVQYGKDVVAIVVPSITTIMTMCLAWYFKEKEQGS